VFEFFQWIQFSPPLVAMRSSTWLFPVIASIHLMGLAVIGGAVLVVICACSGSGCRGTLLCWLREMPSDGSLPVFW
jgi:hypothetical protein